MSSGQARSSCGNAGAAVSLVVMKRGNELVAHLEPAGVCPVGERAPKEANRMGTAHYLLALAGLALAVPLAGQTASGAGNFGDDSGRVGQ